MFSKLLLACGFAGGICLQLLAMGRLSPEQLTLLKDPGGWQYIKMSDPQKGVQTEHTCFDGHPHPGECSGTLTLNSGNTFIVAISIGGKAANRHGTYQLNGNELTLFDELETKDGPYTLTIDPKTKSMVMQMSPAGGGLRSELMLEREYKRQLQKYNKIQNK